MPQEKGCPSYDRTGRSDRDPLAVGKLKGGWRQDKDGHSLMSLAEPGTFIFFVGSDFHFGAFFPIPSHEVVQVLLSSGMLLLSPTARANVQSPALM